MAHTKRFPLHPVNRHDVMQCLYCLQHLVDADDEDRRDVLFCSPFHALSYSKGFYFKGWIHLNERGEEIQALIREYRTALNEPNQMDRYMKAPSLARDLAPRRDDFIKEVNIIGESYVELRGFIQEDRVRFTAYRIKSVQEIVEKILTTLAELLELVSLEEPVNEEDPFLSSPSTEESSAPSPVYRYGFEQEGDAQDYDSIVHRTTTVDESEEIIEEIQEGGDNETQELVMRGPERMVEDDRPVFFANWGYDDSSDEEEAKRAPFRAPNNTPQSGAEPQDKGWLFFVPSPASGDGGDTPSLPPSQRKQQENRGDTQSYNDDSDEEEGFIFELPDARTEKKKRRTGLLLST